MIQAYFMNGLTELNKGVSLFFLLQESYKHNLHALIAQVSSHNPFCIPFNFQLG